MLTMITGNDRGATLWIGLSGLNRQRLGHDQPIVIDYDEIAAKVAAPLVQVIVFGGLTERHMVEELRGRIPIPDDLDFDPEPPEGSGGMATLFFNAEELETLLTLVRAEHDSTAEGERLIRLNSLRTALAEALYGVRQ